MLWRWGCLHSWAGWPESWLAAAPLRRGRELSTEFSGEDQNGKRYLFSTGCPVCKVGLLYLGSTQAEDYHHLRICFPRGKVSSVVRRTYLSIHYFIPSPEFSVWIIQASIYVNPINKWPLFLPTMVRQAERMGRRNETEKTNCSRGWWAVSLLEADSSIASHYIPRGEPKHTETTVHSLPPLFLSFWLKTYRKDMLCSLLPPMPSCGFLPEE